MMLTTERLLLREFTTDDWPEVLAYQTDPRYLRYYPWATRTEDQVRAFVGAFVEQQLEQPRYKFQFAVVLHAEDRLIGTCGLRKENPEASSADLGYELAPACWGYGYATEAAHALLTFGFQKLRLHRTSARCLAQNAASVHVLEKLGMRLEGRLRDHEWFKGRYWDTLLYGILEQEWRAQVGQRHWETPT